MKRTIGVFLILFFVTIPVYAGQKGMAGFYSETNADNPRLTAYGEVFDDTQMTCATRAYPYNIELRVTYKGRSIVIRVNDNRTSHFICLTETAFIKLTGNKLLGTVEVEVEKVY